MARIINRAVFGGGPGFLEEWVQLRDRLEWAVDKLTGLQQPDHSDSEEIARRAELNRAADNAALRDAARDILAGLGLTPEDLIRYEAADARYYAPIPRCPYPDEPMPGSTSVFISL